MSDSAASHRASAAGHERARAVPCAVLTVSDTRTLETDTAGRLIVDLLEAAGHSIAQRRIVPDDPAGIRVQLETWLADSEIRVILTTGGTGIGRRDTTIEVVRSLLTAELDGFGELFRVISFEQIGAAAMLSRAVAGLVAAEGDAMGGGGGDTFIFSMPGSPDAVETAMGRLILPELPHLIWQRG